MKASLSLLVLFVFITGLALVGSAIAQPIDAGPAIAEPASPAEPVAEPAAEAPAPDTAEPVAEKAEVPDNALDQGKALYKNVKGGYWLLAFGFFGMILGSAARFAFGKKWAFLKTKAGGYTIAGFTGMGILGGLIVEAGAFSVSMIPTAVAAMLAAMAMHGPAKGLAKKMSGEVPEIPTEG